MTLLLKYGVGEDSEDKKPEIEDVWRHPIRSQIRSLCPTRRAIRAQLLEVKHTRRSFVEREADGLSAAWKKAEDSVE